MNFSYNLMMWFCLKYVVNVPNYLEMFYVLAFGFDFEDVSNEKYTPNKTFMISIIPFGSQYCLVTFVPNENFY